MADDCGDTHRHEVGESAKATVLKRLVALLGCRVFLNKKPVRDESDDIWVKLPD
jgi:hypothetical protein